MTAVEDGHDAVAALPLQAWRRLDWRFLLQDPAPARVLVGGAPDEDLHTALALLTDDLVVVHGPDGWDAADGPQADLAVLVQPTAADVRRAAAAVRPGGWLYAEVWRTGPLSPGPAAARRWFVQTGLADVRAHWHAPDLDNTSRILPLDRPGPVRDALLRHQDVRHGLAKSLLGRAALRGGVFPLLVAQGSVVGRRRERPEPAGRERPAAPAPGAGCRAGVIDALLHERTAELGLVELGLGPPGPGARWGTALVTPRFVTSRHVVGLVFRERGRTPVVVAKVPRRPGDDGGVEREAQVLRALTRLAPAIAPHVPRVLGTPRIGAHTVLVETALPGRSLDPAEVCRDPSAAVAAGLAFVAALPVTGATDGDGWCERHLRAPLDALVAALPAGHDAAGWRDRTLVATAALARTPLPRVFEHGDLSHPNLLVGADGLLEVLDWERAAPDGMPGQDLAFFLQYVAESRAGAFTRPSQREAFDAAFLPGGWARAPLAEHLADRGLDPVLLPAVLVATWARAATSLVTRLLPADGDGAPRPSPDQVAAAVAQDRDVQLWRHALDRAALLPG